MPSKAKSSPPVGGQKSEITKKNVSVAKTAVSPAKKAPVKKAVVKTRVSAAKETKEATVSVKKSATTRKTVSMKVVDITGKDAGSMQLPSDIFASEINNVLIAQAIRVYLANQRAGSASTKTRGQVRGSTRKIYRQKGTGRARHGGIRAPIFVGGGIVFGPHPRDYSLNLSKKMKKKALFSALSAKKVENVLTIVSGMDKMNPKTKQAVRVFESLSLADKKGALLIVSDTADNVKKAVRNLPYVTILPYAQLNTYDVMRSKAIVFMQDAAEKLESHFLKGDN